MIDINKIIGKNLLLLRKSAKITQMELAEKFNYSDKSISKWENGESLPNIEVLYELAKFYNVSLDDLTKENLEIKKDVEVKPKRDRLFPAKLTITLLAVSAVWFLATAIFVSIKIVFNFDYAFLFVYAIPLSFIILLIFNSMWGKSIFLPAILTILIWTTLLSVHLTFIEYNIWIIYILGIPLQVAIILWATLLKKPEKKTKVKKEKIVNIDNKNIENNEKI